MGFIYKITNKENQKVYIGQTITTVKTRMHKHYSRANTGKDITGIDAAIHKYGKDNFIVETICECPNEDLDEQERYYISKYDSFNNGYNLTSGGQKGSTTLGLDDNEIIEKYKELKYINQVANFYRCSEKTISNILHNNNIKIYTHPTLENLQKGHKFQDGERTKSVRIIELNLIFPSLKECSQWLIDNGYSKAKSMEMARKSLSRTLNGERASYCGLHFEFIKNVD